jgi:Fe-S cluster assembly iron-binding protein IscA
VILTEQALEHLAAALDRAAAGASDAIRLVAGRGGWAMRLDQPGPEDETFDHEGRTVLIVDTRVAEYLEDRTLDVRDTEAGPRLKLR